MPNVVIVGMQWGDEGKGKIVDLLCPAFDAVARFQGGHNAGHTVKFGDRHFALHLIPSGILHPGVACVMGNGMVLHPGAFLQELDHLRTLEVETQGNLFISHRAHLLLPVHVALDQTREAALGEKKIGTTSRGIGPAYETKVSRRGLRLADLQRGDLEGCLRDQLDCARRELGDPAAADALLTESLEQLHELRRRALEHVCDTAALLNGWIDEGKSVLFEGAQGALLDVDHGTYPFVTSSNSTAGGACTGTGVAPTRIDGVCGVLKAYTTRVGEGPFPTELEAGAGDYLRQRGNEFGTTTGRPRRCGWLDLVAARYARRINGVEAMALTKLDVLDTLEEIQVCIGYRRGQETTKEIPATPEEMEGVKPVYRTLKGWRQSTQGTLDFQVLPQRARDYIRFIEDEVRASVALVSTGPKREETVIRPDPVAERYLGGRLDAVLEHRNAPIPA